jgi:hypothetical protein
MSLSTGLASALQGDAPLIFFALEVLLPGYALRLVDGAGQVTIGGNTFLGLDPIYGALVGPDPWNDGVSAEAVHMTFQVQVPSNTAAAGLCSPAAQGAPVTLWFGAVDRATGLVIADPYVLWTGDLDTMTLASDRNTRAVKFDAESAWDRFFDTDEGILLDNATHQNLWPGELGLEFVTMVQVQLPWGADAPRPIVVTDVLGGSPIGAGGGIGGYRPFAFGGEVFAGGYR